MTVVDSYRTDVDAFTCGEKVIAIGMKIKNFRGLGGVCQSVRGVKKVSK